MGILDINFLFFIFIFLLFQITFTTVKSVKCFSMPLHMNSLYPSVWLLTTGAHNLHAAFECHIQRLAETLGSIQTASDFNFKAEPMAALTHRAACLNPSPPVRLHHRSLKQSQTH